MRLRARAATALLASLVLAPLTQCAPPEKSGAFGELNKGQAGACCTDFKVGYDLMVTDFGVDTSIRPEYAAYAQTMGDYVVLATRTLDEVTAACRTLALDFGGSEDDLSVKGRSGSEASYAWCNLAARRLTDAFSDSLQPAGHFTAHFSPSDCWLDAPMVARCELGCTADTSCQETPAAQRCEKDSTEGMCTGKCLGTCQGSATVPASCDGTCDAQCEGVCLGSCYGSCEGIIQAGGRCRGVCLGTCEGVCKGRCTGMCHPGRGSSGKCDNPCKGGCSTPYTSVKCATDLTPPKCPVDPACEANCKALGQSRANCTTPSVTIALGDDISKEIQADLGIQTKIRTLELNLPKLMSASQARGPTLEAELKAAYEAGQKIVADRNAEGGGKLGMKGAACAKVMEAAGEQALADFHVAIDASKTVLKTLPTPK